MKNVRLKRLSYKNYRGQTRTIDFAKGKVCVRGANGTGKSTMQNAFLWLNTLADSDDKANSDLFDTTLDFTSDNAMLAEVEEILDIDGVEYKFKRTAKQKWTRKRGEAEYKKADSDEYTYYVDDLAVSAKGYKERLESVFGTSIDKLKLMLNIRYYQIIDWKTLRKHFADMVGVIDKSELKGNYSKIESVIEEIEKKPENKGNAVDILKEQLRQQINPLKKASEEIETYIAGKKSSLPDITDVGDARRRSEEIRLRIAEIDKAIMGLSDTNKPFVEKRKSELAEIEKWERDMAADKEAYEDVQSEPLLRLKQQLFAVEKENAQIDLFNRNIERDKNNIEYQIKTAEQQIEFLEEDLVRLRKSKEEIKSRVFNSDMICPTCGQSLPEEKVNSARETFYSVRDKDLQEVCECGVRTSAQQQKQIELISNLKKQIEELPKKKTPLDVNELTAQLSELRAGYVPFENTEQYKSYKDRINGMRKNLTAIPEIDASELQNEKERLSQEQEEVITIMARENLHDDIMAAISCSTLQQEGLNAQMAILEGMLQMCISREREWAAIVRDRANRFMSYCKVEMTDISKSGDINDICTVTADGVDVKGTANYAKKVLAGIDIANAFQKNAGLCLPLFLDNMESITESLPSVDNQLILTFADPEYKNLTVI